MKHYVLLLSILLVSGRLCAQTPQAIGRNSVRLGVDFTSLDAPDAIGPRYVGRLARHFGKDRIVIAAEGGYMRVTSATQPEITVFSNNSTFFGHAPFANIAIGNP